MEPAFIFVKFLFKNHVAMTVMGLVKETNFNFLFFPLCVTASRLHKKPVVCTIRWMYLLRSEKNTALRNIVFICQQQHCMSSAAQLLMTCNVVAKKEASLRKRLKFMIISRKPDKNGLLVCTIFFRTEEVRVAAAQLMRASLNHRRDVDSSDIFWHGEIMH